MVKIINNLHFIPRFKLILSVKKIKLENYIMSCKFFKVSWFTTYFKIFVITDCL